ncbi:MAG TPA: hypothetical protein VEJ63_05425 [Planctomycetota bacterium]|nr:hypothetical protein [Planctomycetota bacterium]
MKWVATTFLPVLCLPGGIFLLPFFAGIEAVLFLMFAVPKLKRVHLSTLLLMTVSAAAFMGANTVEGERILAREGFGGQNSYRILAKRGWPIAYHEHYEHRNEDRFIWEYLALNVLVGFTGVVLVGYTVEESRADSAMR